MIKGFILAKKAIHILSKQGWRSCLQAIKNYIAIRRYQYLRKGSKNTADILFVNGCDYNIPHPIRYRIDHQVEQLSANNLTCHIVFYQRLTLHHLRYVRGVVFFRCPLTNVVEEVILEAKKLNKHIFFDIDDLVIDMKYTDAIQYVQEMKKEDKDLYNDGVIRTGKTLLLCDSAITTTEQLAEELSHYVPDVFINRNTASEQMVRISLEALKKKSRIVLKKKQGKRNLIEKKLNRIWIGYFSGSITHNEDFEMILSPLIQVLEENPQVDLLITGELDIPCALKCYEDRIVSVPFMDWQDLPYLLAMVDINLAPLTNTIFNASKSENKWVEAALVKVPTVASDIGAFSRMIENGETGLLCGNNSEWYATLTDLVRNPEFRNCIAKKSHAYCTRHCLTIYTGFHLSKHIYKKIKPNIVFIFPTLSISGGIYVALKHCTILQDCGYDVTLFNMDDKNEWFEFEGYTFPVLHKYTTLTGKIDYCVSTLWSTNFLFEEYGHIKKRFYLVQNFETDFYQADMPERISANRTYRPFMPIQMLTISKWCKNWLKDNFDQEARYASNGIDTKRYYPSRRDFSGKIRILVEGDCGSFYKNVDESFEITNRLDTQRFEIWYMSYNAEPKKHYRIDRFLHKVPFEKVDQIYRQCHILLKTSILESFSYPPLEMMATGGYAVVLPNEGNAEFLIDGYNCLLYSRNNIEEALQKIEILCSDEKLRNRLYNGGIETAKARAWENIKDDIVALYAD